MFTKQGFLAFVIAVLLMIAAIPWLSKMEEPVNPCTKAGCTCGHICDKLPRCGIGEKK